MRAKHCFLGAALVVCFATFSHASVVVGTGSDFTLDPVYGYGPVSTTGLVPSSPNDLASTANGSTSFAYDVLGGYTAHTIPHLNDGTYGNSNSWIGPSSTSIPLAADISTGYTPPTSSTNGNFAGIKLGSLTTITSFSFGRDNMNDFGGTNYVDRALGTYYVQISRSTDPTTNFNSVGWTTIGSITIDGGTTNDALRHQFNLSTPVTATGLRIVVPSQTAIDEIEINGAKATYASKVINGTTGTNGAVAYWRLNEKAGVTTAVNFGSAGSALNGAYSPNPPRKVTHGGLIGGDYDTAAHFTPTSDFVGQYVQGSGLSTAGPGNTNVFANDWTIESWFIRDSVTAAGTIFSNNVGVNGSPILTFGDAPNGIDPHTLFFMNTGLSWGGAKGIDLSPSGDGHEYLGKKVFAVLTKTGANTAGDGRVSMYVNVDGTWLTPLLDQTVSWAITPGDGFFIGRHNITGLYFNGTIDDVALYTRALSQTEVLDQYSSAVPEPGTLALLAAGLISLLAYAWRRRK